MKRYAILVGVLFIWFTYAAGDTQILYDCQIWAASWDKLEPQLNNYFPTAKVLKKDEVEMAQRHLKSYCCAKPILTDGNDCAWAKSPSTDFPESPYLFDQLIDIWFKKLDWDPDRSYWLSVDPTGQDYRKQTREKAEQREWARPEEFKNLFGSFWSNESAQSDSSLPAKYRKVCDEAYTISMSLLKIYSMDMPETALWGCRQAAEQRIWEEKNYLDSISMVKAVKLYTDNLNDYLKEYFNKTRLTYLLEKLKTIVGNAGHVDRKATPAVETASWAK